MSDDTTPTIAEGAGYTIIENASLKDRNTFHVPAHAKVLIDVHDSSALSALFDKSSSLPELDSRLRKNDDFSEAVSNFLVLGEGSNILFTRDWPGVVLSMATRGIHIIDDSGDAAMVRVAAGEHWNDFVRWSLAQGFAGLENLVLIPGTVGAAPIQNIGAYGVEVSEFVHTVEVFDRNTNALVRIDNATCAFAYRDSLFKRMPGRYIVTAVEFCLPRRREFKLDYTGVREELMTMNSEKPTALLVAEAITHLRMRKLPHPSVIGNAGSFFKNPIIRSDQAKALRQAYPTLPLYPANNGHAKLSAAWLIESCQFKGLREGDAGVSDRHALVLVNHGCAKGAEIWALAKRIRDTVLNKFGVRLESEPQII